MSDEAASPQRVAYPTLPVSHWWKLRERFKKSIPASMDAQWIAATLAMDERSARSNVLPALRVLGLIDDGGKTNMTLAARWREDADYKQVCGEMVKRAYPEQLRSLGADTDEERESVRRFFRGHGVGASMVSKVSSLYFMLCDADPAKAMKTVDAPKSDRAERKPAAPKAAKKRETSVGESNNGNGGGAGAIDPAAAAEAQAKLMKKLGGPQLHLNVQVHISPETTPEQIDSIFASMAKHLKTLSE